MKKKQHLFAAIGCTALLCCGLLTLLELTSKKADRHPQFLVSETSKTTRRGPEIYRASLLDNGGRPSAHSSTLIELPDGRIRAYWFAGSREGGRDVAILTAVFDPASQRWSAAGKAIERKTLTHDLQRYAKKLGNPSAVVDAQGRVWLFVVSTSVGGWAAAQVNFAVSEDGGESFGPTTRLVTSPFFNVSTLVRGPAVLMTDETMMLPVYHEFLRKFSEMLVIDKTGRIVAKRRLTFRDKVIQPTIVPTSPQDAVVFMRHGGEPPRRVIFSETNDSGRTFSRPVKTRLPNPNSSVAAVLLGGIPSRKLLMVYNSSESGRRVLSLAVSETGRPGSWSHVRDLERSDGRAEFSYPSIVQDRGNIIHVAYTHNRKNIKHVHFNSAWLFATGGD